MMFRFVNSAALLGLLLITTTTAAIALPVTNKQGDYTNDRRGSYHKQWQVADPDPKGLNCRLTERFRSTTADDLNGPINALYRTRPNISAWTVVHTFSPKEEIEAVSGNLLNLLMLRDQRNQPWLAVRVMRDGKAMDCFVRANVRYIQPINK